MSKRNNVRRRQKEQASHRIYLMQDPTHCHSFVDDRQADAVLKAAETKRLSCITFRVVQSVIGNQVASGCGRDGSVL